MNKQLLFNFHFLTFLMFNKQLLTLLLLSLRLSQHTVQVALGIK